MDDHYDPLLTVGKELRDVMSACRIVHQSLHTHLTLDRKHNGDRSKCSSVICVNQADGHKQ